MDPLSHFTAGFTAAGISRVFKPLRKATRTALGIQKIEQVPPTTYSFENPIKKIPSFTSFNDEASSLSDESRDSIESQSERLSPLLIKPEDFHFAPPLAKEEKNPFIQKRMELSTSFAQKKRRAAL